MSSAVAIGVFDGVHVGHQALLRETVRAAHELGATPAVLTFHPHPACVVAPERAPRLLYSLDERQQLLEDYGIEHILVVPFTLDLSRATPEQFSKDLLQTRLDARAVIVGEGFRFAHKQAGDVSMLKHLGQQANFQVYPVPPVSLRGIVVSSSEIRKRIETGEVATAARLLGRPYSLSGKVVSGHGIGSKQTVPTLNLATQAEVLPELGVYITRTCEIDSNRHWESITNIGVRPTFGEDDPVSIETFLLSKFDGATPSRIRVDFLRRVREERKFASPEELKAQIFRDVKRAQAFHLRTQKWIRTMLG